MLDTTRDVVRKSLLAMLGAITLADDELEQLLDRLAARGEQVARDQLSHVEAVRNRLLGNESMTRDVGHEGRVLQQTIQEEIESRGRMFAAVLDLPTRDSIYLLREQIDRISLALDQFLASRAPVAVSAGDGHAPVDQPVVVGAPETSMEGVVVTPSEPEAMEEQVATTPESQVESSVIAPSEVEATEEIAAPAATEEPGGVAPVPGYDAFNAKQAAALVAGLDEATLLALREYEQANRNRITVLRAIELALARRDAPSE